MEKYDIVRDNTRIGEVAVSAQGLLTVVEAHCAPPGDEVYRLTVFSAGKTASFGVMLPDGETLRLKKRYSRNALRELGVTSFDGFTVTAPNETPAAAPQSTPVRPLFAAAPEPAKPAAGDAPGAGLLPEQGGARTQNAEPERSGIAEHAAEPEAAIDAEKKPPRVINTLPSDGWKPVANAEVLFRESGAHAITDAMTGALARSDGDMVYLAAPLADDEPFPMMPVFCLGEPAEIGGREYLVFKIKDGILTV